MQQPYDPLFPGLSPALRMDVVIECLTKAYSGEGVVPVGATVLNIYYEPGAYCRILYNLEYRQVDGDSIGTRFVFASLLKPGEKPGNLTESFPSGYRLPDNRILFTPFVYVSEIHGVFYSFPVDPSLPYLSQALDQAFIKNRLNRLGITAGKVLEVNAQILRYKPQTRATVLYVWKERDTGLIHRWVGKMYRANRNKDTPALFARIWALSQAAGRRIRIASPIDYISPWSLVLQKYAAGIFLSQCTADSLLESVRDVAGQISELHRLSFPLLRRRSPSHEAKLVLRRAACLRMTRPHLVKWIEALSSRLSTELERCTQMKGPIHGDFQYKNILAVDDGIMLIDLDDVSYGDPAVDVAHFLASLRASTLADPAKAGEFSSAETAFLEAYLNRNYEDTQRIQLFLAGSLLRIAVNAFRGQHPQWEDRVESMLHESQDTLQKLTYRDSITVPEGFGVRKQKLSLEQQKYWCRDGMYARALLTPEVEKRFAVELNGCRSVSENETKGSLAIEYVLSGHHQTGEEWSTTVHGFVGAKSGWGIWSRLNEMHAALREEIDAPVLPLPIAYFPELNWMVVNKPATTVAFSTRIQTPDWTRAADRLGRALAIFHSARVRIRNPHTVEDELQRLRQKIESAHRTKPDLSDRAWHLLRAVEAGWTSTPFLIAPIHRKLHPSSVYCDETRIVFPELEMHVFSHPLIGLASFLARLSLFGFQTNQTARILESAEHIRNSYQESGMEISALPAFEAGAALGLACNLAPTRSADAAHLLDYAENKLDI